MKPNLGAAALVIIAIITCHPALGGSHSLDPVQGKLTQECKHASVKTITKKIKMRMNEICDK